ncbi:hypothetical protein CIK98_12210 [Prevotella sp. P2-180]|nr:hypothetical protein CIK98_12210 [Prevotella sp. P2-180]
MFASTGPAGQALSPFPPEEGEDLGERGGAPLQGKRGRGSFRKYKNPIGTGDRSLSRRNSQKYNLKCLKKIEDAGH